MDPLDKTFKEMIMAENILNNPGSAPLTTPMIRNVEDFRDMLIAYQDLEDEDFDIENDDELGDVGLDLLYDIADILTSVQMDFIRVKLNELTGLDEAEEEEGIDYLDEDTWIDLEEWEEEIIVSESEEQLDEVVMRFKRRKKKLLRSLKRRGQQQAKIGAKTGTELFKRKFQFDAKRKRFVRRKKVVSRQAFRKKARIFKKMVKRRNPKLRGSGGRKR